MRLKSSDDAIDSEFFRSHASVRLSVRDGCSAGPRDQQLHEATPNRESVLPPSPPGQELREPAPCVLRQSRPSVLSNVLSVGQCGVGLFRHGVVVLQSVPSIPPSVPHADGAVTTWLFTEHHATHGMEAG